MEEALDIANYFLCLTDSESGDNISNLKLQKLLYYSQGFNLALYDKPLFKESILAWEHGPVVEKIYHNFKSYGSNGIPIPELINLDFSTQTKDLLNEIFEVYGQFSAWKLRNMTHSETPWSQTEKNKEISHKLMKDFFKTLVN